MAEKFDLHSFRRVLKNDRYEDVLRIYFCYQIGSTYLSLGLLESNIVSAMLMCNKVRVSQKIAAGMPEWQRVIEKQNTLNGSTLGSLIRIIEKSTINSSRIDYLHFLKSKRDYFVHRLYHIGPWPGDLCDQDVVALSRRLLYLDQIFRRATARIFPLFSDLGLLERIELGEDGALMMNVDDEARDGTSLRELLIEATRRRARQQRQEKP